MTTVTVGTYLVYIPSWTTSTNLGPLTTAAFPLDCLESLWDFNTPGLGMPWTQMTQGCAASTCCPSGNFYTEPWAWMTSYYSPGVCPSQYRSCDGPYPPSALSTAPGETIAFCCPTNYNCPNTVGQFFQYCQSPLSTPTSVIVVDNIFNQKTLSTSSWTLQPGDGYSWQVVYPIQVRTMVSVTASTSTSTSQSPRPLLGTSTGTSIETAISGGTVTSVETGPLTPITTQTESTTGASGSGGLSVGDKAGIASAVFGAAGIVVGLLAVFLPKEQKEKVIRTFSFRRAHS